MTFVEGPLLKLAEMEQTDGLLGVHSRLREPTARRLARWTEKMPGASWPTWGGHIALVPNFAPRGTMDEVRAALEAGCAERQPFPVRFAGPISVQDTTRPDYCAVFLMVEDRVDEQ